MRSHPSLFVYIYLSKYMYIYVYEYLYIHIYIFHIFMIEDLLTHLLPFFQNKLKDQYIE